MRRRNENPLIPDSLPADGMQRADDKARGPIAGHVSRITPAAQAQGTCALVHARAAVQEAVAVLDGMARATDFPPAGVVKVADLLEVALSALEDAA